MKIKPKSLLLKLVASYKIKIFETINIDKYYLRSEVHTEVKISTLLFLAVTPCGPAGGYQRSGGMHRLT
jgi:hypothetical protein